MAQKRLTAPSFVIQSNHKFTAALGRFLAFVPLFEKEVARNRAGGF
jgi:hypothetical protein